MTARIQLGYCTNVHAGADLEMTRANLQRHAVAVKAAYSPGQPMGIGLWLSARAARKLREDGRCEHFAGWLRDVGLVSFTFNGFPYGDFHRVHRSGLIAAKQRAAQRDHDDIERAADELLVLLDAQHG